MAWAPKIADMMDEAVERAGLDPSTLSGRHLSSIVRSFNFVLLELEVADSDATFREAQDSISLTSGTRAYALDLDTIDITDVVLRNSSGEDYPLTRVSRQDEMMLAEKTTTGTPVNYWVSKSKPTETTHYSGGETDRHLIVVWPTPDDSTHSLVFTKIRQHGEVTGIGSTPDTQRIWFEAITAGLAARVAEKYSPERAAELEARFEKQRLRARLESRDHDGIVTVAARGFGFSRRRRH